MFRLPDLPTVGYVTQREKQGTDAIMLFMRDVERDRLRLLSIVVEGRERWRTVGRQVFGTQLAVDDDALDAIYDYFTLQACRPRTQWMLLKAAKNRLVWRTIVKFVMPHLEREREGLRLMAKWA